MRLNAKRGSENNRGNKFADGAIVGALAAIGRQAIQHRSSSCAPDQGVRGSGSRQIPSSVATTRPAQADSNPSAISRSNFS